MEFSHKHTALSLLFGTKTWIRIWWRHRTTHNGISKTIKIRNECLRLFNFLIPRHEKSRI